MPITEPIDEGELEDELAQMEQEKLDETMLQTGTVPQNTLQNLPKVANGEGMFPLPSLSCRFLGEGGRGEEGWEFADA